jgi:hypothetical protein
MASDAKILICYSFKDQQQAKELGIETVQQFEFDINEMPEADIFFENLKIAGGNVSYWVANRFVKGYSEDFIWN